MPDKTLTRTARAEARRSRAGHSGRFARHHQVPANSPSRQPRVSVVVPTLNEADNLPHVFSQLPGWIHEVVLVDGLSTDGTIDVARSLRPGIRIVRQERKGKGNALKCGFAAARGDVIVMLDADGSADPSEIGAFVDALAGGADFAKGSRYVPGGGSSDITRLRGLGNKMLGGIVNVLYGTKYSDLCYGYNAFWRSCIEQIDVDCDGFEVETLINIRVARAGFRVAEVPSFEHERIHGQSNLRTFSDGFRVLRTILGEWRRPPSNGASADESPRTLKTRRALDDFREPEQSRQAA